MTLIIGASGRARHGKTDFCEAIQEYVTKCEFRTAKLYDIGSMIRVWCIATGRLPQVERKDMTREQLQILIDGGKIRRQLSGDNNIWMQDLMQQIKTDNVHVALIPNIRYRFEAQTIQAAGGYNVRMRRLNKDGSTFISEDRPPNDITETDTEFWPADAYLTTVEGQVGLIPSLAVVVYRYLRQDPKAERNHV